MVMSPTGTSMPTSYGTYPSAPTYHYNPTMYGYSNYTHTRSIYFKSLLDNINYSHIKGDITKNAFDRIWDYQDEQKSIDTETIFKVDDYYVFGYYKIGNKKYYLVKFED